jgi:hypothetical protein
MRNLCLVLATFIVVFFSCTKTNSEITKSLSGPEVVPMTNNLNGFMPVNDVSGNYLSETNLVSLSSLFGGDAPTSVTDGNLTINFISDFYKVDPDPVNWDGSWGTYPNVESSNPHALYNTLAMPASLEFSKPVKTFGLELFWDGSVNFKVEFWNGNTLVGEVNRSFVPAGSMGQAFLFAATHPSGFNKIVFTPSAPTGFGFAIAQLRYAENQTKMVQFDVYPGSCTNQFNTKSQGIIPMAITGSSTFNVNDVDLATISINGVSPTHKLFEKSSASYSRISECDCKTVAPDNFTDLALKFDKPALAASFGNVLDGAQLILTIKGKLKNGTNFEGKDCVRIKK